MNKIVELIKYGFWGGISTAINLVLFVLLEYMKMNYIFANTISYIIAVLFNFIFNNKFVFTNNKAGKNGLLKFILLRTMSLAIDNLLFFILVSICNINVYISKIFVSTIVITFTYIFTKLFVFNKDKGEEI